MQFERRLDGKLIFSIIAAGILSFTGVVIETAMNVTFPSLMKEFSVSTSLVQWITTGYLLVLAVVIPLSGYLKERFPMKKLFLTAAGLFLLGTLLGAWSPDFLLLLLGRLLQGAGTGIALPLMFNIIMEQAPLDRLGVMVGAGMLVCALAPAVGPSIGGYIVSLFGWRMIFWAVLPLLLVSFVLGGLSVRQSSDIRIRPFDYRRSPVSGHFLHLPPHGLHRAGPWETDPHGGCPLCRFPAGPSPFPGAGKEIDREGRKADPEYPGPWKSSFRAGGAGPFAPSVHLPGPGLSDSQFLPDCYR